MSPTSYQTAPPRSSMVASRNSESQPSLALFVPSRDAVCGPGDFFARIVETPPKGKVLAAKPANVIAIYPGSFDPITSGHLDLIERGSRLFDRRIVAILQNEEKESPLFTVEERMEMLREVVGSYANVEID